MSGDVRAPAIRQALSRQRQGKNKERKIITNDVPAFSDGQGSDTGRTLLL